MCFILIQKKQMHFWNVLDLHLFQILKANSRARGLVWKLLQPRGNIFNWFHAHAGSGAAGWRVKEGKDKNDMGFLSTIESL